MKKHLLLGLLACSDFTMAQDLKASINTTTVDGYLHVMPSVENTGSTPIQQWQYQLSIAKQSPSGTSTSQQSGHFNLDIGAQQQLSQSRFNVRDSDKYQLRLSIWHNGQLITEAEKHLP